MSWFTYDMLPDTMEDMNARKKRKKKKSSEEDDSEKERMKAAKNQKKEDKKKQRGIHLKAYSEVRQEGKSGFLSSSTISTSTVDTSSIPSSTSNSLNSTPKPQTSQLPPCRRTTQLETQITSTT